MKNIKWISLLSIMLVVWSTSTLFVSAQFGCNTPENFNGSSTNLPDGWITTHGDENDKVQWALNGNGQYCSNIDNLVLGQSGSERALCASSDNAVSLSGDQTDGTNYNTAVFSRWFPTQNVADVRINYDLHYQSLSDELVFVLKFRDNLENSTGGSYTEVFSQSPDSIDYPQTGSASPAFPVEISMEDIVEKIGGIPPNTTEMQIAWRYRDTGDDFADWYVQIDDVSITCEYANFAIDGSIDNGLEAGDVVTVSLTNDTGEVVTETVTSGVQFDFVDVPAGTYTVTVSGYNVLTSMPIVISQDASLTQTLSLGVEKQDPTVYAVNGNVDGEAVVSGDVLTILLEADGDPVSSTVTISDTDNVTFALSAVSGTYTVTVSSAEQGMLDVSPITVTISADQAVTLTVEPPQFTTTWILTASATSDPQLFDANDFIGTLESQSGIQQELFNGLSLGDGVTESFKAGVYTLTVTSSSLTLSVTELITIEAIDSQLITVSVSNTPPTVVVLIGTVVVQQMPPILQPVVHPVFLPIVMMAGTTAVLKSKRVANWIGLR